MQKNAKNYDILEIHQFLILVCLSHYPKGITFAALFKRMHKIFPGYFEKSSTFYYHISNLVDQNLIHSELIKSLPPVKKLIMTEKGGKIRQKTLQPLMLLELPESKIQDNEKKCRTRKEQQVKFSLDQAEQIELITGIQYQILNFTDQEMEELNEKSAKRLTLSAKAILNSLCRSLGISLE